MPQETGSQRPQPPCPSCLPCPPRLPCPSRPTWALFRRRRRSGFRELGRVDGHVELDVGQRHVFLSVKPCDLQVKWNLDAADVAVVAVVDLCRQTADARVRVANEPREQARFAVEIKRREGAAGPRALNDLY